VDVTAMTYGMLRVKNEAQWIERVIKSILPVCDRILVFDDHSTDQTAALCSAFGCKVIPSPFTDGVIHEARDKDYLLEQVWKTGAQIGDHCLMVDGDEALYALDIPAVKKAINHGMICVSMHIVYLWDSEEQIRVDRWYKDFHRPSLFRLTNAALTFRRTDYGGNFHCSSAPSQLLDQATRLPIRLLHYGYMEKATRIRKYHFYNKVDPNNLLEDHYRHMVIGDLYPANSVFKWAGPLEVAPL
jgi:glycosyltransferase involved in cell wall biosynthesis